MRQVCINIVLIPFIDDTNYSRFGERKGQNIWNEINKVFDAMPLAAVVDNHIFCTHGGIPEERKYDQLGFKRSVNSIPVPLPDPEIESPLAWDLMWADPARETDFTESNQHHLFLENTRRKTSCLFTEKALKAFLDNTGYNYVIRAHECQVGFIARSRSNRIYIASWFQNSTRMFAHSFLIFRVLWRYKRSCLYSSRR